MRYLIILAIMSVASCGTRYHCYPTKGSRDYATVKPLKSGLYKVTVTRGYLPSKTYLVECNPCEGIK